MKARGCQIKEPDLVATICDYCLESRIRVPNILEGVSEYFIEHGHKLSTPQIFSLTRFCLMLINDTSCSQHLLNPL